MPTVNALDAQMLYQHCDPSHLPFETTDDLAAATEIVGQERAVDAIRLGLDMRHPGYNLFVLGDAGSGRHSAVRRLLEAKATQEPLPSDWCYINNFAEPNKPRLLSVPAGRGGKLKRDMQQFVAELSKAISAAFESDEYRSRLEAINETFKAREEKALQELARDATDNGIVLVRTPHGFIFAPLSGEEPMEPPEFDKLPDAERARIGDLIKTFSERLKQLMVQFPRWRREVQAQIKEASRETLSLAVGHLIEELKDEYQDLPDVLHFLDEVMHDIVEEGEQLREQPRGEGDASNMVVSGGLSTLRYQVNLLVDNSEAKTAPIIFEDNPIYPNLVGRVDHISQMGTLLTNFTLIKPGALQRANGGYLVLDALKVLLQPYAWEGLKRSLRSGQVHIESLGQAYGLISTISLEPQPMPINLKVLLIGERRIYYLLKALDPEFAELFKIGADFESELVRDATNTRLYAEYIATLARQAGLRPFERDAVARVIEHTARLCGDAERLCTSRWKVSDLLQEADHWAGSAGRPTVRREDIETALAASLRRADRIRSKYQEEILRDTLLISVSGERIGQINGLAVVALDDFRFAHPVRITATARVGSGDVIDIERETELGGPIHSKGVLILSSFLGARYARTVPLSLDASLVFEQSYGPIEGDSASMAELCALLSVLAKTPIRQSLAITGSVNQFGDAQAIGGVNEKIEGFFDICQARGLAGDQGVLIPAANVKHLMLRQDIIDACTAGRFAVFPYNNVDEAIERLTGVPADTINAQVAAQLTELSELRKAFAESNDKGGKDRG
ncbi:Lon protease family protein [Propionivibrio limicola]|uniref:Lon protease family protein n=1 Tax=Propionivibrio limicola TaxID=167645 RepID=UPI0012920A57|nr:ATP-binding protein [Propionivibrio limicola]